MKRILSLVIFSVIILTTVFSTNVFANSSFERVEDTLVILVEFTETPQSLSAYNGTDYTGAIIESDSYYSNLFFDVSNNSVYSVRNYFRQQSGGKLDLPPAPESYGSVNDGIIRVKLDFPHPNDYVTSGKDNGTLTADASRNIATAAINKAAQYIDFAYFDKNSDEKLTRGELHVNLVLASGSQSQAPGTRAFNADSPLASMGSSPVIIDGVNIVDLPMSFVNSRSYYGNNTLGTYCHEMAHSLGAVDLYTIPNNNITNESIMNNSNMYPPTNLDPFNKMIMGFVEPTVVSSSGTYTVNSSLPDNPERYNVLLVPMISEQNTQEYLLIENRQFNGFDTVLSGNHMRGGVAIWHVSLPLGYKYDKPGFGLNGLKLRLEAGDSGSFYYNGSNDTLDISSAPSNSRNFYGNPSGVSVKVNSRSSSSMSVDISFRKELKYLKATLNGLYTTISWDPMDGATEYEISRDQGPYVSVGSNTQQCYVANAGYHVYRVRAKNASGEIIGISQYLQVFVKYYNKFASYDLNFIRTYLEGYSTPSLQAILDYDVNGDNEITNEDYILIEKFINNEITELPVGTSKLIVYGDTNEDGMVTSADALRVRFNYFENIAQKVSADLDVNNVIDSRDLEILENYLNNGPDLFSYSKGIFKACTVFYSNN